MKASNNESALQLSAGLPSDEPALLRAMARLRRRQIPSFVFVVASLVLLILLGLAAFGSGQWTNRVEALSLLALFCLIQVQIILVAVRSRRITETDQSQQRADVPMAALGLATGLLLAPAVLMAVFGLPESLRWVPILIFCMGCASVAVICASQPWSVLSVCCPPLLVLVVALYIEGTGTDLLLAAWLVCYAAVAAWLLKRSRQSLMSDLAARVDQQKSWQTQQHEITRLSHALQQKHQVAAAGWHDVHQPVQAIGALIGQMHRDGAISNEALDALLAASQRLQTLTQNLSIDFYLDEEHDQRKPVWVSLNSVFNSINPSLSIKADLYGMQLRFSSAQVEVRVVPLALERTLQNLIDNALEHSRANIIEVNAQVVNERVILRISDDGVGLGADISSRFRQLQDQQPDLNGAALAPELQAWSSPDVSSRRGLGLRIAVEQARRAGIDLHLEAGVTTGTTFCLCISQWRGLAESDGARAPSVPSPTVSSQAGNASADLPSEKSRVLLIDDDALVRLGLAALINAAGFEIIVWDGGDYGEIERQISGSPPDVIVSDWWIGKDTTAIASLRAVLASTSRMLPVVIVSGDTQSLEECELSAQLHGVHVRVLQKPVSGAALSKAIVQLLDKSAAPELAKSI